MRIIYPFRGDVKSLAYPLPIYFLSTLNYMSSLLYLTTILYYCAFWSCG
jgi:hypothetical protein